MSKKDLTRMFIDEIYFKPPKKNYLTSKVVYNHIDEIWIIDLADMIDYKISNKGFRYIFVLISLSFFGVYLLRKKVVKLSQTNFQKF